MDPHSDVTLNRNLSHVTESPERFPWIIVYMLLSSCGYSISQVSFHLCTVSVVSVSLSCLNVQTCFSRDHY